MRVSEKGGDPAIRVLDTADGIHDDNRIGCGIECAACKISRGCTH